MYSIPGEILHRKSSLSLVDRPEIVRTPSDHLGVKLLTRMEESLQSSITDTTCGKSGLTVNSDLLLLNKPEMSNFQASVVRFALRLAIRFDALILDSPLRTPFPPRRKTQKFQGSSPEEATCSSLGIARPPCSTISASTPCAPNKETTIWSAAGVPTRYCTSPSLSRPRIAFRWSSSVASAEVLILSSCSSPSNSPRPINASVKSRPPPPVV